MPQTQLSVLFSNGKAICFFPTTSLQTREEFELFLEREYEKFYPTDSVSIKNVQYLYVDKSTNTPIKFELPNNWDDISCTVKTNVVEAIFGRNPMIFVELDDQPKQSVPQYEIVSPIPASSRKKPVERAVIGNIATSLFSTTSNTAIDEDEKVVIFEVDDDSVFDKPIAEKEKEQQEPEKPAQTESNTMFSDEKPTTLTQEPSQDSAEIDFDEEIIFSDSEETVEKQLFPTEPKTNQTETNQTAPSEQKEESDEFMDDILSQSNEDESVKMDEDLNENILCTQAVDAHTEKEESPQEVEPIKQQEHTSPAKQILSTPQKSSQTPKIFTPKSSQEKAAIEQIVKPSIKQFTPKKSSQEKTPKSSQEQTPTSQKLSQEKTPKPSQEKTQTPSSQEKPKVATPKSSQEKTPKPSQEKTQTPKSSQEKTAIENVAKPAKQFTPKSPISIMSKIKKDKKDKNFRTPNPPQSSREDVFERSKSTTKKRKRDQLSSFIAKKAIDSMSNNNTKKKK